MVRDNDGVRRRDPELEKGKKRLEGFRQAVASWKGTSSVGRLMHLVYILRICIPFVREFTQRRLICKASSNVAFGIEQWARKTEAFRLQLGSLSAAREVNINSGMRCSNSRLSEDGILPE